MPYMLEDLVIDRVDLVDDGANSAAFIQIYKRKERGHMEITEIIKSMKPEHAEEIQKALDDAAASLATATTEIAQLTEELQKTKDSAEAVAKELAEVKEELAEAEEEDAKKAAAFDEEEVIKAMPEPARELFQKERIKREAAEEQVRKAREAEEHTALVAKAATLKALPVEQEALIGILKGANEQVVDLLTTVATAIEGTVLDEVGKSAAGATLTESDAGWAKIEAEANKIVEADPSITKQRAIASVIKNKPELYKEYLKGGSN